MISALRQPAYARRVHAMRAQHQAPHLGVWIVDGWRPLDDDGQFGDWTLVVPDDIPVQELDFRCIAGLFVLVQADDLDRVDEIAQQVAKFKPVQIFGYADGCDCLTCFIREAA